MAAQPTKPVGWAEGRRYSASFVFAGVPSANVLADSGVVMAVGVAMPSRKRLAGRIRFASDTGET